MIYPGQKAGYLGSAFYIGNFAGSMTWGWLSDILGRRPVMLLGVCGTIFSELLFGFSQNFGWAIAGRFLWGLLNGNLGVVKTYVSEVRLICKPVVSSSTTIMVMIHMHSCTIIVRNSSFF